MEDEFTDFDDFDSSEISFLPQADLSYFKPNPHSKHILECKRLKPEYAWALQKALNKGTDHIAGYFAWAENAYRWNTKNALVWIQAQLSEPLPSEYFAFFLGKELVGMGAIRPYFHPRHVQMSYWVSKGFLKQGIGECIALTIENLALKNRPYQYIYINHDSSNRASGSIPQKLGYSYAQHYMDRINAKSESGLWFSWVKESDRYANCINERLSDLRYADLWCQMIFEMHPNLYTKDYVELHQEAKENFAIEYEKVRTKLADTA